ncbi:MAG: acyltransferase [Patescibacteria group bacterium]
MKDKNGNDLTFNDVVKKGRGRASNVILEFFLFIVRLLGFVPSHILRKLIFKSAGVKIGRGSTIHSGAVFYDTRGIEIGEDTIIGENSVLDGRDLLKIGSHTALASEVMIYNCQHDVHDPQFSPVSKPVIIGDYVFVGPRAIILPGVKVGDGAVIAAGAVVTNDVESYQIVAGIPAKVIGERKAKDLKYKLGRPRLFR